VLGDAFGDAAGEDPRTIRQMKSLGFPGSVASRAGGATVPRRASARLARAFKCLAGGSVGLVGGDAPRGGRGRCSKTGGGQQFAQPNPDPLGRRVRGELHPRSELLDAACVERLVTSERQQQLRHAMGESTKHRSQSAVADYRAQLGMR
jgi:hypothetical protein